MGAIAQRVPPIRFKTPNFWTDERVEQLKQLWAAGYSASEIVEALGGGVSRNAVLGKVVRLKLEARTSGGRKRIVNPLGARADRKKFADGLAELRRPENEPAPLTDASGARLTILTARANQCRWIAGDAAEGEICGHPGTPYCPHHAARARVAGTAKLAPGERPTVWQLPGAFGRTHAL